MKKIIFTLAIFSILTACSKNDEATEKVYENDYFNMLGKWYFKETIKSDGSKIVYNNRCSSERDYWIFNSNFTSKQYTHDNNCIRYSDVVDVDYWPVEKKFTSLGFGETYYITKITETVLNLSYIDMENTPYANNRIYVLTRN
jgi:hypothetical protein